MSSAESRELQVEPIAGPTSPYVKSAAPMSLGYNRGGVVIQRGVAAAVPSSSSSATPAAPSVPRSYQPLVEEWALVMRRSPYKSRATKSHVFLAELL